MQLCMRLIGLIFLTFVSSALQAQHSKLLLMGSFHFANPGLDTIKNKQIDVSQPAPQAYIRQLVAQLAKFQPNVVMLEYDPKDEEKINQRYQQYLASEYQLPINEMYQIGFRLAQQAGLKRVYSADEREVQWQGDELINYMQQQDQQAMANFQQLTSHMQQTLQTDFDQLSLQQMLVKINQAPYEKMNRNIYLQLNATGKQNNFVGADSAASWWHRNFRMYARIQRQAKGDARIFVLAGQGHTSLIRQFVESDEFIQQEPVEPYLKLEK